DAVLELMIESKKLYAYYNIGEAGRGYAEKMMIAWQVRVKNIMKTDALGRREQPQPVTSSSSISASSQDSVQQFFWRV
ncbi:hypothetical protein TNIN_18661, partial [Trichonephila inaurata madagascariensis]